MYNDISDDEIIYMIKEDEDYYDMMFQKYKPLALSICKKYLKNAKKIGYEIEDLMQIANMGIVDAIRNYRTQGNTSFYTFLLTCVKNRLNTEIRNQQTNKKKVLNEAISYDKNITGTDISLLETLPDKMFLNPFDSLLISEQEIANIHFLNSLPFEVALVYELRRCGFPLKEIEVLLEIDRKSINQYLNIVRQKIAV